MDDARRLSRQVRFALFLVCLAIMYGRMPAKLLAYNPCSLACDTVNTRCDFACFDGVVETCGDYGVCYTPTCGDGICDKFTGETCDTCTADCGTCPSPPPCGDSVCELGETSNNCPGDCPIISPPCTCGADRSGNCITNCPQPGEYCDLDDDCTDQSTYGYLRPAARRMPRIG